MLRRMLVIALGALIVSACSTSREATEVSSFRAQDSRMLKDSVKVEKVVVEVHDTIMETTTITVDRNEIGDTLKVAQVTERDRVRDRTGFKVQDSRVMVKSDTVYIEKRDSVEIRSRPLETPTKASSLVTGLRWVFGILVLVIILVLILKFRRI